MKSIIRRVTAFAMAFTLLGAGTAVTRTLVPKADTTITADAATAGAYKVKSSFAFPISFSMYDGNMGSLYPVYPTHVASWVININVHQGTVLSLDSRGVCTSGYDCQTGYNFKGFCFSSYIGTNLTKLY